MTADAGGIFFGAGLICCVGPLAAMAAAHFKRKFDKEAEEFSRSAEGDGRIQPFDATH